MKKQSMSNMMRMCCILLIQKEPVFQLRSHVDSVLISGVFGCRIKAQDLRWGFPVDGVGEKSEMAILDHRQP
jgi:hypothetical protein